MEIRCEFASEAAQTNKQTNTLPLTQALLQANLKLTNTWYIGCLGQINTNSIVLIKSEEYAQYLIAITKLREFKCHLHSNIYCCLWTAAQRQTVKSDGFDHLLNKDPQGTRGGK